MRLLLDLDGVTSQVVTLDQAEPRIQTLSREQAFSLVSGPTVLVVVPSATESLIADSVPVALNLAEIRPSGLKVLVFRAPVPSRAA
jgi:hypothetical protein